MSRKKVRKDYSSGGWYEGEMRNDRNDGKGIKVWGNGNYKGDRYDGEWIDGKRNGQGIYYYNNGIYKGDRYEGGWKVNKKNGYGVYYYANGIYKGDRYEGGWVDSKKNGRGVYFYANGKYKGDRYDGEWKDGKKNGHGVYNYTNGSYKGDRYDGGWKDGRKHGHGVYYYAIRGDRYDGEWNEGEKHGHGIYYYSNGDRFEGEWRHGVKLSSQQGKKKDMKPQKKLQKGVISFKFQRITSQFRDTDTSDFVIKTYQRSSKEFKTTRLAFIDSEDVNNPKRKEYILSENDSTKLRDLKMAIRRTYIITPFTLSSDQPMTSQNEVGSCDDKLKIFLEKNNLGKYYNSFSSGGVSYEDLTIFVEDENTVDDFVQMNFHKKKLIRAIKSEFNC